MATTTKQRSLLARVLRARFRRKDTGTAGRRRPDGGGNAGVREPRRPNPVPPALAASVEESD